MPELSTSVSPHVFYRKMGAGPVMVLLHGFPESSSLWRNVWDKLSASFTLIIPDMPGIGQSQLQGDTSIADMAVMLKEILDAEQIQQAVFTGHSMGGYIAMAFARLYPAMVAGLSFVHSMPNPDDQEKKKTRNKVIKLVNAGGKDLFLSEMVPHLFADDFKDNNPPIVKEQVDEAVKMEAAGVINFYRAMRDRDDNLYLLNSVAFPIQWVIGLKDNIMAYKKILSEFYMSEINFVSFYHDCGHMSMIEAPELLIADLEKFGRYSHHKYSSGI